MPLVSVGLQTAFPSQGNRASAENGQDRIVLSPPIWREHPLVCHSETGLPCQQVVGFLPQLSRLPDQWDLLPRQYGGPDGCISGAGFPQRLGCFSQNRPREEVAHHTGDTGPQTLVFVAPDNPLNQSGIARLHGLSMSLWVAMIPLPSVTFPGNRKSPRIPLLSLDERAGVG